MKSTLQYSSEKKKKSVNIKKAVISLTLLTAISKELFMTFFRKCL